MRIRNAKSEVEQRHFWVFHTEGDVLLYREQLKNSSGCELSILFCDTAFQPAEIAAGYSKVVYAYDENGEVIRAEYYDVDGQRITLSVTTESTETTENESPGVMEDWINNLLNTAA